MAFGADTFARTKGVLACLLALLLSVTPVCGALCKAQACGLPETADKSPCHESASGAASDQASGSFRTERNCGLQELPVALPADFRSCRPDSAVSANAVGPAAVHGPTFGPAHPVYASATLDWRGRGAIPFLSISSIPPLRI